MQMDVGIEKEFLIRVVLLFQTVAELGVVIFTALDYGLKDEEERQLSPALENVIDLMTSAGKNLIYILLLELNWSVCKFLHISQAFPPLTSGELPLCVRLFVLHTPKVISAHFSPDWIRVRSSCETF